jgi:hypothetical protein
MTQTARSGEKSNAENTATPVRMKFNLFFKTLERFRIDWSHFMDMVLS